MYQISSSHRSVGRCLGTWLVRVKEWCSGQKDEGPSWFRVVVGLLYVCVCVCGRVRCTCEYAMVKGRENVCVM